MNEPTPILELEFVAHLRRGDERAWAEFVRESAGRMLGVARRITADEAEAEEATQDGFLAAYQGIAGFDGRSALSTWLHRIMVRTALGRLRARRRRQEISMDNPSESSDPDRVGSEAGDDPAARHELSVLVRGAIDALPDEFRAVLVLRDVEELSSREVATLLGISDALVRQRLHRARQSVAERLRPELCDAPGITCGGRLDLLFDYLDRTLADDVADAVLDHVGGCATCQGLATKYEATMAAPREETPWSAWAGSEERVLARFLWELRRAGTR